LQKHFLITISILLIFFFLKLSASEVREPEDFRGIKWGEHINNIPGMKKISTQNNIDIYKKENDKLQINGARVKSIEYYFNMNRFMGVYITFKGINNFNILKKFMFNTYGPGKKRDYFLNNYVWLTKSLLIKLNYTARTNSGFILYCYLPLWKDFR
jgi:hypothetical protein